jgi:hypothetical protein
MFWYWLWLALTGCIMITNRIQHGARGQAVPRLVRSHCRQSNFRRAIGVAQLSLNLRSPVLMWLADARCKERLANFDEP